MKLTDHSCFRILHNQESPNSFLLCGICGSCPPVLTSVLWKVKMLLELRAFSLLLTPKLTPLV